MNIGNQVMADKRQNYYRDKSTNDAITISKRSTAKPTNGEIAARTPYQRINVQTNKKKEIKLEVEKVLSEYVRNNIYSNNNANKTSNDFV